MEGKEFPLLRPNAQERDPSSNPPLIQSEGALPPTRQGLHVPEVESSSHAATQPRPRLPGRLGAHWRSTDSLTSASGASGPLYLPAGLTRSAQAQPWKLRDLPQLFEPGGRSVGDQVLGLRTHLFHARIADEQEKEAAALTVAIAKRCLSVCPEQSQLGHKHAIRWFYDSHRKEDQRLAEPRPENTPDELLLLILLSMWRFRLNRARIGRFCQVLCNLRQDHPDVLSYDASPWKALAAQIKTDESLDRGVSKPHAFIPTLQKRLNTASDKPQDGLSLPAMAPVRFSSHRLPSVSPTEFPSSKIDLKEIKKMPPLNPRGRLSQQSASPDASIVSVPSRTAPSSPTTRQTEANQGQHIANAFAAVPRASFSSPYTQIPCGFDPFHGNPSASAATRPLTALTPQFCDPLPQIPVQSCYKPTSFVHFQDPSSSSAPRRPRLLSGEELSPMAFARNVNAATEQSSDQIRETFAQVAHHQARHPVRHQEALRQSSPSQQLPHKSAFCSDKTLGQSTDIRHNPPYPEYGPQRAYPYLPATRPKESSPLQIVTALPQAPNKYPHMLDPFRLSGGIDMTPVSRPSAETQSWPSAPWQCQLSVSAPGHSRDFDVAYVCRACQPPSTTAAASPSASGEDISKAFSSIGGQDSYGGTSNIITPTTHTSYQPASHAALSCRNLPGSVTSSIPSIDVDDPASSPAHVARNKLD